MIKKNVYARVFVNSNGRSLSLTNNDDFGRGKIESLIGSYGQSCSWITHSKSFTVRRSYSQKYCYSKTSE